MVAGWAPTPTAVTRTFAAIRRARTNRSLAPRPAAHCTARAPRRPWCARRPGTPRPRRRAGAIHHPRHVASEVPTETAVSLAEVGSGYRPESGRPDDRRAERGQPLDAPARHVDVVHGHNDGSLSPHAVRASSRRPTESESGLTTGGISRIVIRHERLRPGPPRWPQSIVTTPPASRLGAICADLEPRSSAVSSDGPGATARCDCVRIHGTSRPIPLAKRLPDAPEACWPPFLCVSTSCEQPWRLQLPAF
jgi:hypothetical protein